MCNKETILQSEKYLSEYNMLSKKYEHIFKLMFTNFDDYYKSRSPQHGNYSIDAIIQSLEHR